MGGIRVRLPSRASSPISWRCSPAAALLVTMQPTFSSLPGQPQMTNHVLASTLTDCVDNHCDQEVQFLSALVQKPSDNPPGDCAGHAEMAAQWLERIGFTVERHAVPADDVTRAGMVSATNLVVRHRFGAGPVIALNAHGDVGPPGDGWSADPYGAEIGDGLMIVRGAAVSRPNFATEAAPSKAWMDSRPTVSG